MSIAPTLPSALRLSAYAAISRQTVVPTSSNSGQVRFATIKPRQYSTTARPPSTQDSLLRGVRILDFTRILAGPFCTQILADYGADVIKVEQPGKGDETRAWKGKGEEEDWKADVGPMSFFFSAINRNKRSITLDLKRPEGKEAVHRLVEHGGVDVVIENFVPGAADRLGIGYKDLSVLNDRLIYASLSGYGASGPYSGRAGYDAIAAAETGFMQVTGHPDQAPVRAGLGMTDMSTGLYVHGAIMGALYNREHTGKGQYITTSLFETQISMLIGIGVNWLNRGVEGQRYGAAHPNAVPYNAWKCKDGIWMVIAANSEKQYQILCEKIRRTELIEDERFKTNTLRVENRVAIDAILTDVLATKTADEWLEVFAGSGLAHGPVNTLERAFEHPQIDAREMIRNLKWDAQTNGNWKAIGPAVKFSETRTSVRRQPPKLGEHTEEVLGYAGYSKEDVDAMKKGGAV